MQIDDNQMKKMLRLHIQQKQRQKRLILEMSPDKIAEQSIHPQHLKLLNQQIAAEDKQKNLKKLKDYQEHMRRIIKNAKQRIPQQHNRVYQLLRNRDYTIFRSINQKQCKDYHQILENNLKVKRTQIPQDLSTLSKHYYQQYAKFLNQQKKWQYQKSQSAIAIAQSNQYMSILEHIPPLSQCWLWNKQQLTQEKQRQINMLYEKQMNKLTYGIENDMNDPDDIVNVVYRHLLTKYNTILNKQKQQE